MNGVTIAASWRVLGDSAVDFFLLDTVVPTRAIDVHLCSINTL